MIDGIFACKSTIETYMTSKKNPWFRMYSDFMFDEKVEFLSFEDQRHYVFILCMKNAGLLDKEYGQPGMLDRVVAKRLGLYGEAFESAKRKLIDCGLVSEDFQPIAWVKGQYMSDCSTDRVKAHRERVKQACNVSVTPPDTETDTDTEAEAEKDKKTKGEPFVLPDWIPGDTWAAFMEIRKGKKAKNTDYALKLLVNTLTKLKAAGHDPVDVINTSIKAGWSDVYPPKLPASAMTPGRRTPAPENFAGRTYTGGKL